MGLDSFFLILFVHAVKPFSQISFLVGSLPLSLWISLWGGGAADRSAGPLKFVLLMIAYGIIIKSLSDPALCDFLLSSYRGIY